MKKIFAFINSGRNTAWINVIAISEDGLVLAGHCSSCEDWAKHDIGITSDWKHNIYQATFPDGYELEWVDSPETHEGCQSSFLKNQALEAAGLPVELPDSQPSVEIVWSEA